MTNRLFLTTMLCCVVCTKGSANVMITTAGFELVESNWNDKHFLLSGDSHKVASGDFVSPLRSQADEDRWGTILLTEPVNDTRSISEDFNTTVEMIQSESTNDTGDTRTPLAGAQQISENETVTEHVQRIIENYNTTVEMMHSESTDDTGDIRTPLVGAQQTSETETVTEHVQRISEDYNTTEEMTHSEWTNDTGDIGTSVVGSPQTLEHDVVTQDVQRMNGSLQISTVGFQFSISTLGVDEDMRGSSSESPASGRETSANESLGLSFDVNGSLLEETTSLRLTELPTNGLNTETSERGVTFFGLSSPRPGSPPEDQPIISSELAEKIIDVLDKVRLPLEMASGLVTFTSACVYLLPDMRSPTAMYLVSMNLLDTVSVVTGNVGLIWRLVAGNDVTKTKVYNQVQEICLRYLAQWTRRCVYCLAVLVSLERFFAISFPLKARFIKIIRFPKLSNLSVIVVCGTFHVYQFLAYHVVYDQRSGRYVLGYTSLYVAHTDAFNAVANAAKFLFSYLPLVAGAFLSVALYVVLRRSSRARATLHAVHEADQAKKMRLAERQLSRTIWVSNALFTLLSLPINTVSLVSTYHATFGPEPSKLDRDLYVLVTRVALFLLIASRFTNFLSYASLSTAFRRNLLRCFRPSTWVCRSGDRVQRAEEEEFKSEDITMSSLA